MKGTYVLHLRLAEDKKLCFGTRFSALFKKGDYVYVGSALNNLEARLRRHMSNVKTFFWHIDFLVQHAQIKKIYIYESKIWMECLVAQDLASNLEVISKFGSSGCKCAGHLFWGETNLVNRIIPPVGFYEYTLYQKD
ncbi:MAG: GIY-YIG nuclease family protein [Candidatus Thermoplasmatota archaeon]|nr:GIY-YIG nuclease family protein [Candidatus Thermoplasmatota archaeon]MBU1941581.1 GIY-YIG nuclease family protein [Candidatus Thermoplasmatota archaeon]